MAVIAGIPGIEHVVLDIEGTLCPITFVKDVLYPFALAKLKEELSKTQFPIDSTESEFTQALDAFPQEFKSGAVPLYEHARDLTDRDIKAPYWKRLQGILWNSGYASGELKANLYDDATSALIRWHKALDSKGSSSSSGVYIYSSGSVAAQKLLFAHVAENGDMNKLLSGYFDSVTAGPKTETESYNVIAANIGAPANSVLFFSDNPKEITAANKAGWHTAFTYRDGNPVGLADFEQPELAVTTFEGL